MPTDAPAITPIKLMRKQYDFVYSDAPEILSSGAFGTGKTRGLCYRAVRLASHPSARVGLCRLTHTALKRTTLATLLEPDGDLPPVLEPGSYTRRKAPGEEEIRLTNGGRILPFGCEDPVTIASLQLTDCCIDEGIELEEKHWDMLIGRCRVIYTLPDGTRNVNTLATATNPGAPGHFLHKKFIELTEEQRKAVGRHLIRTKTTDNWHLDPSYYQRLSRFTGAALRRYMHGEWCAHEGAIYPMFAEGVHVLHRPGPWVRFVAGVDYGFSHPSALRVQGLDGTGSSHVVAELYETDKTPDEFADACQAATTVYSPITFVVDPSAPALIKALRQRGLHAIAGNSNPGMVLGGIGMVQNALTPDPENNGQPRLTFEPSCARGTDEYLSYHWKEGALKEQPEKKDDHACDADRYAVMYIQRGAGTRRLRVVQPRGTGRLDLKKTHRQRADGTWIAESTEAIFELDKNPVPGFILP